MNLIYEISFAQTIPLNKKPAVRFDSHGRVKRNGYEAFCSQDRIRTHISANT